MSILGPIPEFPANDFVSSFVDKCKHNDMVSDTFGDEDTYYNPQAYFENTVNEIAESLGMSTNGVLSVLHRVKSKFSRNLFIMNNIGQLSDDEMADVLNSGIANINRINCNDFFETELE